MKFCWCDNECKQSHSWKFCLLCINFKKFTSIATTNLSPPMWLVVVLVYRGEFAKVNAQQLKFSGMTLFEFIITSVKFHIQLIDCKIFALYELFKTTVYTMRLIHMGHTIQSMLKGPTEYVLEILHILKLKFVTNYCSGNNVWKFHVSTMKIECVARIWSSCITVYRLIHSIFHIPT